MDVESSQVGINKKGSVIPDLSYLIVLIRFMPISHFFAWPHPNDTSHSSLLACEVCLIFMLVCNCWSLWLWMGKDGINCAIDMRVADAPFDKTYGCTELIDP